MRIGLVQKFLQVRKPIPIGVGVVVLDLQIEFVFLFPGIGESVLVGIGGGFFGPITRPPADVGLRVNQPAGPGLNLLDHPLIHRIALGKNRPALFEHAQSGLFGGFRFHAGRLERGLHLTFRFFAGDDPPVVG